MWKEINWTVVTFVVLTLGLSAAFLWVMLREPEIPNPPLPTTAYVPELDGVMNVAQCQAQCHKACMQIKDADLLGPCLEQCKERCKSVGKAP